MDQQVLFGRYRLVARAGSGGTAEVWRAIDERTGEEVALKRLHPGVFASEAGRRRLVREFRALRDLRHPNVVAVRDLEIGTDDAALILDYVPGPSLRERLATHAALPPGEAVAIARDVAAALAAAHAAGIVHRDVSPGNVLLAPDGTARLTDFGIADAATEETAVTATGTLVGTLRYVAPEQLRGEPATPSSDLYGLAAVTWEMLAGRPPFAATTPVELVESQRAELRPIEGLDPRLDAAVRRGLALDPGVRPRSVGAFAASLLDALDDRPTEPIALPLPAARPTPRARSRAGPVAVGAALALGALILVGALGATDPAGTGGTATETPRPTNAAETSRPSAEPVVADEDRDGRGGDEGDGGKGKGKDKGDGGKGKGRGG
jgi:hypothetical protein